MPAPSCRGRDNVGNSDQFSWWRAGHAASIPPDIERVILIKAGTIVADGPKERVLTEEKLFLTYDTPVRVARVDGYYLAYPQDAALPA